MRNREIRAQYILMAAVSLAGIALGFALGGAAALLCAGLALALCAVSAGFTLVRYREIRRLSEALQKAQAEGAVLDVRNNREGELSILKNDLFKVTSALAGQADRLRQEKLFLANALSDISHQLKTPLTSLLVHSDLLQDEDLPPEKRREFLARVNSQLERIRWLVSALLKLSRIDAAVVEFKREDLSLHSLLSQSAEPVLAAAEQKGVAVSIECPPGLRWTGDMEWTREAIGNLIKNCVEYTPPESVVRLCCQENPLQTLIFVEDEGPGFAPEDLPHIFERFYRGRKGRSSESTEGVGIGLAMAKLIFQSQRADVEAENRPEGGARFTIRLWKRV